MHPPNCSLFKISIYIFFLSPLILFSQSSIRGKVVDAKNLGVPFASVFLINTTLGVSTGEDGSFEIKNIPNGQYDFTVSAVGFKRFQQSIEFLSANRKIEIRLKQDSVMLSEVVVRPNDSNRKYLGQFKKLFLGTTSNSLRCDILNPEDLDFVYDKDSKILTAQAIRPIVVENKALGYRIHYTLDFFEYNEKMMIRKVQGAERFENIESNSPGASSKNNKKRQEAYRGSLRHFMVALYNNKLKEERFTVSLSDSSQLKNWDLSPTDSLDLNQFLKGAAIKKFYFKGILKVSYAGEYEDWSFRKSRVSLPQVSYLIFMNNWISIFENGYYYDQLSVFLHGYLAWSEVISENVPSDFNLIKK
ncbi:carboxypeptidase-like regulatory domain-containing protein [soil metagenome]